MTASCLKTLWYAERTRGGVRGHGKAPSGGAYNATMRLDAVCRRR
jgi:hypothetical protein